MAPLEIQPLVCVLEARAGAFDLPAQSAQEARPEPDKSADLALAFDRMARLRSSATAFETPAARWTYAGLRAAARQIARLLRAESRLVRGARVVLRLPNSPEYAAAFYGVLLAGGVVVPVPPQVAEEAFERTVQATEASAVLMSAKLAESRPAPGGWPVARWFLDPKTPAARGECREYIAADDDLAAIFFTAGSTGAPKGVMLSHRNLLSNARAIQEYLRIDADERPLCILPFHHAFGNSVLQSHLLAGATLVLDGDPAFPESIAEALARRECTSLSGVPDLFRLLLGRTSLGQTALPALRSMAVAGGALPSDLARDAARRIAPAEFFVMYGQTEATARLAYVPPHRLLDLPDGCIGRAIPGVTLQVVDGQGRPVPAGVSGELRARGPGIMLGYWRDPQGTREKLEQDWLKTGDLAAIDEQGWISLRGRANALVKIAGHRVHPSDLEQFAVRRLPVAQAIAVPVDTAVGTRFALFVQPAPERGELSLAGIRECLRRELPRHLVPDSIRIVDELPLNDAMKIDRPRLARIAREPAAERARVA